MSNRLLSIALAILAATLLGGCSASVDAQGNVLTDRVWFDASGNAHCPNPECTPPGAKDGKLDPKLKPTEDEIKASLVRPHSNECDKHHPVTWAADDVVCWACQGAKHCPKCMGTGSLGKDRPCAMCIQIDNDGKVSSTGICGECAGKGTIRWGGGPEKGLRHEFPDGAKHDF